MTMARHTADLLSLAFGLLFAATGLLLISGGLDTLSLQWVPPVAAIVLGGILILAARSIRADPGDAAAGD